MTVFGRMAELYRAKRYDEVLKELEQLERDGRLPPNLLVLRGDCIQLSSVEGYELADAEEAYKAALDVDDRYVPALLELGWFYDWVKNDASAAEPFFEKALSLSRERLVEAVRGLADCIAQLQSRSAALDFIHEQVRCAVDSESVAALLREIEELPYACDDGRQDREL